MADATEEFLNVSAFKVSIDGVTWDVWESVDGLGLDIEDVPYQGDKNKIQNRPGRCNARDLTLTRRFRKDEEIAKWVEDTKKGKKDRKSGSVVLLDDEDNEVCRFNFFNAWPKGWSGPRLTKDTSGNQTLMEEVVLSLGDLELAV